MKGLLYFTQFVNFRNLSVKLLKKQLWLEKVTVSINIWLKFLTCGTSWAHCTVWKPSWLWSYGSWIYNYLCNQCLSPLMLWVRISIRARFTTLCDEVCQWLVTGQWFSPGPPVSSTNKTDHHDIPEMLLKVALNTMNQTNCIV